MNGIYDGETVAEDVDEAIVDEADDESDDEAADAEGFWDVFRQYSPLGLMGLAGGSRPSVGGRYYQAPGPTPFVTQGQLRRSLSSVRRDVRRVNARVGAVQTATARLGREVATQRKVAATHTRLIRDVRNELAQTREMSMLLPLLMQPKALPPTTQPATIGGVNVGVGTSFSVSDDDSFGSRFPILMMAGGLPGFGSGGTSGSSGQSSNMMTMLLVIMIATGKLKF
jgi:hypothetical protein